MGQSRKSDWDAVRGLKFHSQQSQSRGPNECNCIILHSKRNAVNLGQSKGDS